MPNRSLLFWIRQRSKASFLLLFLLILGIPLQAAFLVRDEIIGDPQIRSSVHLDHAVETPLINVKGGRVELSAS